MAVAVLPAAGSGSGARHGPVPYYGPPAGRPGESGEFAFITDPRYWRCRCGIWNHDRVDMIRPRCGDCGARRRKDWSAPAAS